MNNGPAIRILLTDRDRPVKIVLEKKLPEDGPLVVAVRSGAEAGDLISQQRFDVSQVDFELPGIGRVETRRRHGGEQSSDLVLVNRLPAIEEETEEDEEDEATARAVLDALSTDEQFLTKPFLTSQLALLVREESRQLGKKRSREIDGDPILGASPAIREVLELVGRIAAGSASVLIHGETGTGKTMVARRIHQLSPRADQRFVAINCSAFQDQLLESELFGHEKGAFTGAIAAKQGLFEVAHGGTLFLDEIGDMTSAMQAKLLHVLDNGEMRRVGGTKVHKVDVRIVAASNKDLQHEVKAGRFREDLLFRLNVIHFKMPRLADRRSDIPLLIEFFLDRFRIANQARKHLSPEAIQLMMSYNWPGNVRELGNMVEGLTLLAPGNEIRAEDLPPALRPKVKLQLEDSATPLPMAEVERLHILHTLRYTEGKKAPAARLLGVDIKTLNSKIKSYGIE
jgi:two-component system response regulator AtoC